MKQGHSNVRADETKPWDDLPFVAKIPIAGGAKVWSVKTLPPLSLNKDEWYTIGEKMGWISKKE
jgi:hypothetical protein